MKSTVNREAANRELVFRLPDLGEGLTEAEILVWRVAEGDTVQVDQVVVEVETAKAVVEVPVPFSGSVLRLHVEAGAVLSVGEPLISVGADGADDGRSEPAIAGSENAAAQSYRQEEQAGSGNVLIGYGTGHAPGSRRRRRSRVHGRGVDERGTGWGVESATDAGPSVRTQRAHIQSIQMQSGADSARPAGGPLVISPLVRKLAKDHGVDVTRLIPSGTRDVILRRDVEQAARSLAVRPQAAAGSGAGRITVQPATVAEAVVRIPLTGLRRTVADKLSRSRTEIPDATTWVDVDATALLAAKADLQAADPERRIGLLALLARFCVAGLRRFPQLNSTVDTARAEIVQLPHVNLGFAAQTDRGLLVPVVRGADRMTTAQLAAELARLTALARTGGLPAAALTGGTFTLNNYGVFGVDGSTPIINHPEAALLGVGRITDKPWVVDGALAVRKVTQLSLSFDHRVCDGAVAGGFLRFVADCVERPALLLAEV